MAEIVPLRPSEHDAVQQLLPWHITGTLAAGERARVEAHLAACEECRHDLSRERELAREVALLPLGVDEGWQAMAMRLPARTANGDGWRATLFGRSAPLAWAVGGALAASAVFAVAIAGSQQRDAAGQTFHTLGSAGHAAPGQAVVLFRPDTTERQMRAVLAARGARVVDGPTAAGAFVLRFDGRNPADAVEKLRQSSDVVLAEPLAGDGRP